MRLAVGMASPKKQEPSRKLPIRFRCQSGSRSQTFLGRVVLHGAGVNPGLSETAYTSGTPVERFSQNARCRCRLSVSQIFSLQCICFGIPFENGNFMG
jgi:hypothetical protein